jgi:hypothetical protein
MQTYEPAVLSAQSRPLCLARSGYILRSQRRARLRVIGSAIPAARLPRCHLHVPILATLSQFVFKSLGGNKADFSRRGKVDWFAILWISPSARRTIGYLEFSKADKRHVVAFGSGGHDCVKNAVDHFTSHRPRKAIHSCNTVHQVANIQRCRPVFGARPIGPFSPGWTPLRVVAIDRSFSSLRHCQRCVPRRWPPTAVRSLTKWSIDMRFSSQNRLSAEGTMISVASKKLSAGREVNGEITSSSNVSMSRSMCVRRKSRSNGVNHSVGNSLRSASSGSPAPQAFSDQGR